MFNLRWILIGVLFHALPAYGELTLDEAENLALEADPALLERALRAQALQDQAVTDGQLPDPKLLFGLWNLPLDDFSLTKEPATQWRTGIRQTFPRGETLKYRQARTEWLGRAEAAGLDAMAAQIRRDVRETYLELFYQAQAAQIISESRRLFVQLVEITRAHYGAGRVSQQDVLQAQLELSRLDDRASRIDEQREVQRARLARWIGAASAQALGQAFPRLPGVPALAQLESDLARHPSILAESAQVQASRQRVQEAREQYKPGFSVGLEYRKRFGDDPDGSNRSDQMAAMVTLDLPLFTDKRQDRSLAASQARAEAAAQARALRMRELKRSLESDYSRWRRLGEQAALYRDRLLPEAAANAEAAVNAYQSGEIEFISLMRARINELDVRLQALRVRIDRARAAARLLYLAPQPSHPLSLSQEAAQ
ncbi:MAG: transporter [Porticoccaceae bacterium]|nr:transporter [Porticoccaceae bacterium]